ncbi:hypothetical protein FQA39_LY01010 [Lamprigera yunnana]|nr:hypothetical protein FQA39_LY01010 [Lamprigera yunnana]
MFEMIEEKKILMIEEMCGNEGYLGWESVSEIWSLELVLSYSSGRNFKHFYEDIIRAVAEKSGNAKINIYNILDRLSEISDDIGYVILELEQSAPSEENSTEDKDQYYKKLDELYKKIANYDIKIITEGETASLIPTGNIELPLNHIFLQTPDVNKPSSTSFNSSTSNDIPSTPVKNKCARRSLLLNSVDCSSENSLSPKKKILYRQILTLRKEARHRVEIEGDILHLEKEAQDTAKFFEFMNDLFDSFEWFPLEKRLMEKWLINCGNINLIDLTPVQLYEKRVCASHFSCKHFTNSLKNRLIQGAVPLHYNTKENADKQLNISTETLNLKREAVPKVYKQSRVAEDPIPSAAAPLSEINDDSASELNKSPTLLQVVGVCDIFSFGLALYLTQTLYRVSRNEGAKRKSQLVDIILCRFNPNYLSPKMLLKRAGAPYR